MGQVEDLTPLNEGGFRVFVDAKIMGRHDVKLPHKTLVAYVVEGRESHLHGIKQLDGIDQTDEAELHAVYFAIDELKSKLGKIHDLMR